MIGYICGHLEQFKPHKIRGFRGQKRQGNIVSLFCLKLSIFMLNQKFLKRF